MTATQTVSLYLWAFVSEGEPDVKLLKSIHVCLHR